MPICNINYVLIKLRKCVFNKFSPTKSQKNKNIYREFLRMQRDTKLNHLKGVIFFANKLIPI